MGVSSRIAVPAGAESVRIRVVDGPRHALVIGNGAYIASPLRIPANDTAMTEANEKQSPWVNKSSISDFYMVRGSEPMAREVLASALTGPTWLNTLSLCAPFCVLGLLCMGYYALAQPPHQLVEAVSDQATEESLQTELCRSCSSLRSVLDCPPPDCGVVVRLAGARAVAANSGKVQLSYNPLTGLCSYSLSAQVGGEERLLGVGQFKAAFLEIE